MRIKPCEPTSKNSLSPTLLIIVTGPAILSHVWPSFCVAQAHASSSTKVFVSHACFFPLIFNAHLLGIIEKKVHIYIYVIPFLMWPYTSSQGQSYTSLQLIDHGLMIVDDPMGHG